MEREERRRKGCESTEGGREGRVRTGMFLWAAGKDLGGWGGVGGGEGILHHRDEPMRGLGENVQRECPSNSGVNTTAASVSILDRRRHPPQTHPPLPKLPHFNNAYRRGLTSTSRHKRVHSRAGRCAA